MGENFCDSILIKTLITLQGYSVRREVYGGGGVTHASHGLYLVVCVGVAALLGAAAIGVAVVRRRNAASPHAMGFVEVCTI